MQIGGHFSCCVIDIVSDVDRELDFNHAVSN